TLKTAGRLTQGENVVVQHLLQDTGMVLGHQVSGAFGITERPQGTLAEQFLHAEATNLQLSAGMALAHNVAPGIQGLERGLELSLRSTAVSARFLRLDEETSPLKIQPALVSATDLTFPASLPPPSLQMEIVRMEEKQWPVETPGSQQGAPKTPNFHYPPEIES